MDSNKPMKIRKNDHVTEVPGTQNGFIEKRFEVLSVEVLGGMYCEVLAKEVEPVGHEIHDAG